MSSAISSILNDTTGLAWLKKSGIVILIFLVLYIIIETIRGINRRVSSYNKGRPYLVTGTKNAKRRKIIVQNPSERNAITLKRSTNEISGLEFTYSLWFYVDDWGYNYGKWKHIFHKGNENSWPARAPGVWFHPKQNSLRIYMNTFKKINEYVDINNIPLHKWIHLTVSVQEKNLDVYINGYLKNRHKLEGIPRQNYGDVYINNFGGYSGFLSNFRYFDYYVSPSELEDIINLGPSSAPCVDTGELPPYLSPDWWISR